MRLIDADAIPYTMLYKENWLTGTGKEAQGVWKSEIDRMPTVEERKTGKWMPFEYGNDEWHKCSACGIADHYVQTVERENGSIGRLTSVRNYCPNCGAKMEESERC